MKVRVQCAITFCTTGLDGVVRGVVHAREQREVERVVLAALVRVRVRVEVKVRLGLGLCWVGLGLGSHLVPRVVDAPWLGKPPPHWWKESVITRLVR